MTDQNVFDAARERSEEPNARGGDFADWWEPDDEGERLVGVIVEMHSAPRDWTESGEVPDTIYTVLSLGRGDHERGDVFTPKQHKQLKTGLDDAGLHALVDLEFKGYDQVNGNLMHRYSVGVVPEDEWGGLDGADDIQEAIDEYKMSEGAYGDNRRTEPYTGSASSTAEPKSTQSGGAGEHLADLLEVQGGELTLEKADTLLNDVADYDVDPEEAAAEAGLEVDDGVVRS